MIVLGYFLFGAGLIIGVLIGLSVAPEPDCEKDADRENVL